MTLLPINKALPIAKPTIKLTQKKDRTAQTPDINKRTEKG